MGIQHSRFSKRYKKKLESIRYDRILMANRKAVSRYGKSNHQIRKSLAELYILLGLVVNNMLLVGFLIVYDSPSYIVIYFSRLSSAI